jgi:hypothetical protein
MGGLITLPADLVLDIDDEPGDVPVTTTKEQLSETTASYSEQLAPIVLANVSSMLRWCFRGTSDDDDEYFVAG